MMKRRLIFCLFFLGISQLLWANSEFISLNKRADFYYNNLSSIEERMKAAQLSLNKVQYLEEKSRYRSLIERGEAELTYYLRAKKPKIKLSGNTENKIYLIRALSLSDVHYDNLNKQYYINAIFYNRLVAKKIPKNYFLKINFCTADGQILESKKVKFISMQSKFRIYLNPKFKDLEKIEFM